MARTYQTPQCKVLLAGSQQDVVRTSIVLGEVGIDFGDITWGKTIKGGFGDE
jgi:hypothetical protein